MNTCETINFYEALRQMEQSSEPFSVTWCKYSNETGKGGGIAVANNVLFQGKRETEQYELMFFTSVNDNSIVSCHLYSLMYFNNLKMIIE